MRTTAALTAALGLLTVIAVPAVRGQSRTQAQRRADADTPSDRLIVRRPSRRQLQEMLARLQAKNDPELRKQLQPFMQGGGRPGPSPADQLDALSRWANQMRSALRSGTPLDPSERRAFPNAAPEPEVDGNRGGARNVPDGTASPSTGGALDSQVPPVPARRRSGYSPTRNSASAQGEGLRATRQEQDVVDRENGSKRPGNLQQPEQEASSPHGNRASQQAPGATSPETKSDPSPGLRPDRPAGVKQMRAKARWARDTRRGIDATALPEGRPPPRGNNAVADPDAARHSRGGARAGNSAAPSRQRSATTVPSPDRLGDLINRNRRRPTAGGGHRVGGATVIPPQPRVVLSRPAQPARRSGRRSANQRNIRSDHRDLQRTIREIIAEARKQSRTAPEAGAADSPGVSDAVSGIAEIPGLRDALSGAIDTTAKDFLVHARQFNKQSHKSGPLPALAEQTQQWGRTLRNQTRRLSEQFGPLLRVRLPSRPDLAAPSLNDLNRTGGIGMLLIVGAIALIGLYAMQRRGTAFGTRWPELPPAYVSPDSIQNRGDVVRAFESLALRRIGVHARYWTHGRIGRSLDRADPSAAQRAVELYELARYAPPDFEFTDQHLLHARNALRQLLLRRAYA